MHVVRDRQSVVCQCYLYMLLSTSFCNVNIRFTKCPDVLAKDDECSNVERNLVERAVTNIKHKRIYYNGKASWSQSVQCDGVTGPHRTYIKGTFMTKHVDTKPVSDSASANHNGTRLAVNLYLS